MLQDGVNVYNFLDYRSYVRESLARRSKVSLTSLGSRVNGISKSYLSLVLSGQRDLGKKNILALGRALGLKGAELRYFDALVRFNHAKDLKDKEYLMRILEESKPKSAPKQNFSHSALLQTWHCLAIREFIKHPEFVEDAEKVSRAFKKRITAKEVIHALSILQSANLICRNEAGRLQVTTDYLKSGDECLDAMIRRYHDQCLRTAQKALFEDSLENREFGSITLLLDPEQFQDLKQELKRLQEKLLQRRDGKGKSARVCQVNYQLISLTE